MGHRRSNALDSDDVIRRYKAGETIRAIARVTRARPNAIADILRPLGILRGPGGKLPLDIEELKALYASGIGCGRIAHQLGVSPQAVRNHLKAAGVEFRDRNDYPPVVEAAHAAARSRTITLEERIARARRSEEIGACGSHHEAALATFLAEAGVPYTPQKALAQYNLDFLLHIGPVAVEIRGGGYGAKTMAMRPQRLEQILDRWHLIEVDARNREVRASDADNVITLAYRLSRQPAPPGQYWVVRCQADPSAARRADPNLWPAIRCVRSSEQAA